MRKGQGLSVNMMILIVLGLVILLISIVLVTKQFKKGDSTITDATKCPNQATNCKTSCAANEDQSFRTCDTQGLLCCLPSTNPTTPTP